MDEGVTETVPRPAASGCSWLEGLTLFAGMTLLYAGRGASGRKPAEP